MSEYAFYHYMTEVASTEQIEECDSDKSWPATFDDFMEKYGNSIQENSPQFTDEAVYGMWRTGIWQEGFIHALAKQRRGDEDTEATWWSRDYEQGSRS